MKKSLKVSEAQEYTPVILSLGSRKWETQEFKASLGYIETLTQNKKPNNEHQRLKADIEKWLLSLFTETLYSLYESRLDLNSGSSWNLSTLPPPAKHSFLFLKI